LVDGWRLLNIDPSNYSAQRFLADSYAALPRQEIAWVSELLQSQLLQPINITPVQPQLAESNLFILSGAGPAEPSLNEFHPLLTRNRFALLASGVVGIKNTLGDELVLSGVWEQVSYSLCQLHFGTDGFRAITTSAMTFTMCLPKLHCHIKPVFRQNFATGISTEATYFFASIPIVTIDFGLWILRLDTAYPNDGISSQLWEKICSTSTSGSRIRSSGPRQYCQNV
jgi:hypothetical protein